MKNMVSDRVAIGATATIISLVLAFHALVITGVIPYAIVWGGRITSAEQMHTFEAVSILINLVMMAVIGLKAGVIRIGISPMVVSIALWVMFGLFLANTIGNLLSTNLFEKLAFTPLTLLLAIFCLKLATSKNQVLKEN